MPDKNYIPKYTYSDYEKWQGNWELIYGAPVAMSPSPKRKHQVIEIEKAGGAFSEVHGMVSGKMQDIAWTTGDVDAGMVTFGMCGGLVDDIPTCEGLVENIMTEANQIISERLASMVS